MSGVIRSPVIYVYDPDKKQYYFRVAGPDDIINHLNIDDPVNRDTTYYLTLDFIARNTQEISEYPFTTDYPHRGNITHTEILNPSRRVNNLVPGPVTMPGGKWFYGTYTDTEYPDVGMLPCKVFEIDVTSVPDKTIAIDYFITRERRNGAIEHVYYGTAYAKPESGNTLRFFTLYHYTGHGARITVTHRPEHVPQPTDLVATTQYFIPRLLVSGEVAQNVQTRPSGRHVSAPKGSDAVHANSMYI